MELKTYQKRVIADLVHYLELLNETRNYPAAFKKFWQEKSNPSLGVYHNTIPGVPNLCFKVPTGGGKTFLACNAIRPVFDALPDTKMKAVVWLVPSDAILTQTVKALKDTYHPYRQKIDKDFGSRVVVYTKQELLNGQNFNFTAVTEQLSIMVLSYDSFRSRGKEGLKAYQENSNLAAFAKVLGKPEAPIENADETALFQIINQLNPLVIVDESHHARSDLSIEMLTNFHPCFVLDLTATPKKRSNIISYVDAMQLKKEHMVKLPVIVYNRDSKDDVLDDAIDMRNHLERIAVEEEKRSGRYIRPIALFQAQPKGKEDNATFEDVKKKLVARGISAEQIAIRTADVNELKNVDLQSRDCHVRYIITVNALKEGWDCPFAYILASLANKNSQVDVEQILGRILRLPHTTENGQKSLNMSYVLTSSNDFRDTVSQIVKGLNSAGFSDKDCRLSDPEQPQNPEPTNAPTSMEELQGRFGEEAAQEEHPSQDDQTARDEKEQPQQKEETAETTSRAAGMLDVAEKAGDEYERDIEEASKDPATGTMSREEREKVTTYKVKPQFQQDIEEVRIPQFFRVIPANLFSDGDLVLLDKAQLAQGFSLKGKSYDIDFAAADDEIVQVDVKESEGGLPRAFKVSAEEQQRIKEHLNSLPPESRVKNCADVIFKQLNRSDVLDAAELKVYVDRIVGDMTKEQLTMMEKSPMGYANKIKKKIDSHLEQYRKETFQKWLDTEKIVCKPYFNLPPAIHPTSKMDPIGGSLYETEEGNVDNLEVNFAMSLTALPNVRWWHRNISRHGFRINGYINHYPDFLIMTNGGKLILAETKGGQLDGSDSQEKIELGEAWKHAAGNQYRYYMIFKDGDNIPKGAVSMSQFFDKLKDL